MVLGSFSSEVTEVVTESREEFEGHYMYSELCALDGPDGMYGVSVIVVRNSLADKLQRVFSFRYEVTESGAVEEEFQETTRKGLDVALRIREDLQADARKYIEDSMNGE